MRIFRKIEEIPADFGPTVASVGNFDGVHLAHRRLIESVRQRASELGARSVLVTFEPHPMRILRPSDAPKLITPGRHRLRLLRETGIDALLVLPFSRDLSNMSATEFAAKILAEALKVKEVHEGFNFTFGRDAAGDITLLKQLGETLGYSVVKHAPLRLRGHIVSSTQVRKLVKAGEMHMARRLLTRPFSILHTPGRGRGFGTKYAVPTINLSKFDELIPAHGVYVTGLRIDGEMFESVTNVGNRPTFGPDSFAIESHILNFHPIPLSADTEVELIFHKRLREERRYPSVDLLKEQIAIDVKRAQRCFDLMRRYHAPRTK